jgi:Holliday junction resolvase RusA-like endonuclease
MAGVRMSRRVAFTVVGKPEPAGSKRAFKTKSGKVVVTDDNPHAGSWKGDVSRAAAEIMDGDGLLDGPVGLVVIFTMTRPRSHFGKNGVLPSAPARPMVRPDATKLLRGVEDALTGVVWHDDGQVVEQSVAKVYGEPAGAQVVVWTL